MKTTMSSKQEKNPAQELADLEKKEPPVADKKKFEKKINDLKIKAASNDMALKKIQFDIDKATADRQKLLAVQRAHAKERNTVQDELNAVKKKRDVLKGRNDQTREISSQLKGKAKGARSRFGNIKQKDNETMADAITREIKKIERKIEMGECSTLKEEKDLLRDIDKLKVARREAGDYETKNAETAGKIAAVKQTGEELKKEIGGLKKKMDNIFERLQLKRDKFTEAKEAHDEANEKVQNLLNKRKEMRETQRSLQDQQRKARSDFQNKSRKRQTWERDIERARQKAQRYNRTQKAKAAKEALEAEDAAIEGDIAEAENKEKADAEALKADIAARKAARDEKNRKENEKAMAEYQEELAKWKAAQKKQDPYEKQKAQLNRLIIYCQGFLPKEEAAATSSSPTRQQYKPKGSGFTGDEYGQADGIFSMAGTKKKGKKKKKKKKNKAKQIQHDISLFGEFEAAKITLPMTAEEVPATIDALKTKLQFYLDKPENDKKAEEARKAKAEQRKKDAAAKAAQTTNADDQKDEAASGDPTMMDLSKLPPNKRKEMMIAEKRRKAAEEAAANAEAQDAADDAEDAAAAEAAGGFFGDDSSDES